MEIYKPASEIILHLPSARLQYGRFSISIVHLENTTCNIDSMERRKLRSILYKISLRLDAVLLEQILAQELHNSIKVVLQSERRVSNSHLQKPIFSVVSFTLQLFRLGREPMDIQENKSQSSQDDGKEFGDDDIIGRMEIDDASDMTEVAGILLHLNVIFVLPTIAQQVMIHVSTFVIQA